MTITKGRPAREELGRLLVDTGCVTPQWQAAFEAVDRAWFLPDLMWRHDMVTGGSVAVDRTLDPDVWLGAADSDVPIVTQWDDGAHTGSEPGNVSTSSASMPSVVFRMLRDLDVQPGMRVLEIGTGTGYNAALLACQLGDDAVTSIEVDPAVTAQARAALDWAGRHPHVVCADGGQGWPAGAPYDRVIATVGMRSIPVPWLEQTRPGGIILAPWGTDYTARDALAPLTVAEDGSASGQFTGWVEFMKLRAQRLQWPRYEEYLPDGWPGDAASSTTDLSPDVVVPDGPFDTTAFIIGLGVPACTHTVRRAEGGVTAWFLSLSDKSWAAIRWAGDEGEVYQSGERRLWDEVEATWRWWDGAGQPGVDQFGLTVWVDGTHEVWLGEPGRRVPSVG